MKNALLLSALAFIFVGCNSGGTITPSSLQEERKGQVLQVFAEPPPANINRSLGMQAQTAGALVVLRNHLDAKGMSLAGCSMIKAYLRVEKGQYADLQGFSAAYSKVFGTRLVPNQPQLVQIQVIGFENPTQLVLLEAQCQRFID